MAIEASDEQQGQPGRTPDAILQPLSLEPSLPLPPVPPVPASMICATRESGLPAPLSPAGGLVVVPPSCSGLVKPPSKKGICAWTAEVPEISAQPKARASNPG